MSSSGAQKVDGIQAEGGRRALGSPLSPRTKVFLASDSLPPRHIPECQGLNLDPMLKCRDKQCKYSDKPLNTRDLRPVADHSRHVIYRMEPSQRGRLSVILGVRRLCNN